MANKEKAYKNFKNKLQQMYKCVCEDKNEINNISELNEAFDDYKEAILKEGRSISQKNMTFGILNYIMESNIEYLMKNDKKVIKEYVDLVKNDKNLSSQYLFINALKNYSLKESSKEYIQEALALSKKNLNKGQIYESNLKVIKFLKEHHLGKSNISKEIINLYENCDFVLKSNKKLSNLNDTVKAINEISSYVDNHKIILNESKDIAIDTIIKNYNEKYNSKLTTEEKEITKQLLECNNSKGKEKLFVKLQNECIKAINGLYENTTIDEKSKLIELKETVLNLTYNENTIIEDITKLLEMKDILNEDDSVK